MGTTEPPNVHKGANVTTIHVLGVDPSLTGTGLALVGPGTCVTTTVGTKGKRADSLADRDRRLAHVAGRLADFLTPAVRLAVIEGPARVTVGSTLDRYGLWWRLVHRLHSRDIPVAVCAPATRAKWSAGTGRADKAAVAVHVARMWQAVELADDNQADALCLATMGAQYLGIPLPCGEPLARHLDTLPAVAWPDIDREGAA